MFKKSILAIMIAVVCIGAFAQKVDEVTLTVSSDAPTKDEATKLALRSAIEQAFGVFVSANTTILNDELVKDEIATVASGNIKKYDEISSVTLPNGNTSVTLRAVVSLSRLTSYAQSKGSSVEFASQTFAMNMKLLELNKANEETAIKNMLDLVVTLVPGIFDYKLDLGQPQVRQVGKEEFIQIPATIFIIPNSTLISDIVGNTLLSLSMSNDEQNSFKQANMRTYELGRVKANVTETVVKKVNQQAKKNQKPTVEVKEEVTSIKEGTIVLRNDFSEHFSTLFNGIVINEMFNFKIVDNLGGISKFDIKFYSGLGHRLHIKNSLRARGNSTGLLKTFSTDDKYRWHNTSLEHSSSISYGLGVRDVIDIDIPLISPSYTIVSGGANSSNDETIINSWGGYRIIGNKNLGIEPGQRVQVDRIHLRGGHFTNSLLNGIVGLEIIAFLVFPQADLTKYNNFEIMRNED